MLRWAVGGLSDPSITEPIADLQSPSNKIQLDMAVETAFSRRLSASRPHDSGVAYDVSIFAHTSCVGAEPHLPPFYSAGYRRTNSLGQWSLAEVVLRFITGWLKVIGSACSP